MTKTWDIWLAPRLMTGIYCSDIKISELEEKCSFEVRLCHTFDLTKVVKKPFGDRDFMSKNIIVALPEVKQYG